jgi:hypothetical protein
MRIFSREGIAVGQKGRNSLGRAESADFVENDSENRAKD